MKETRDKKQGTNPSNVKQPAPGLSGGPMSNVDDSLDALRDTRDGKIAELEEDLKRVQAEFMNYRRRQEEERGQILDLAKQDVVLQILPILDNVHRALGHLPEGLKANAWAQGVERVAKQAEDILLTLDVRRFTSVGQPFDHNLHEAIAHEGEGDTVIEELQPGYRMGDKVIRHALVRVGRK